MSENFGEEDHDNNKYFIECDEYGRRTILDNRCDDYVTVKKCAMNIFNIQAAESNNKVDIYT